jgi:hypothetical protein
METFEAKTDSLGAQPPRARRHTRTTQTAAGHVRVLLGVSQHRRIIQGTERVGNSTSPCLFQARLGALGGELCDPCGIPKNRAARGVRISTVLTVAGRANCTRPSRRLRRMARYLNCENSRCRFILDRRMNGKLLGDPQLILKKCPECGGAWSCTCPCCAAADAEVDPWLAARDLLR